MLVVLWVVYLVAFFGRPTLGPVVDFLPGSGDLFLRRFVVGVDLVSLVLLGVGAVEIARLAARLTVRALPTFEGRSCHGDGCPVRRDRSRARLD